MHNKRRYFRKTPQAPSLLENSYVEFDLQVEKMCATYDSISNTMVQCTLLTCVTTASVTSPLKGRKTMALYLTGYSANPLPG